VSRIPTGIAALDLVLGGGFPPGSLVVIAGAPGTGKTILAQQMCFANPRPSIYYTTLSEPHSKLVSHLQGFSFYSPEAVGERKVECELAAVAFGEPAIALAKVATGTELRCKGFLARRYRTGITLALHVNEFESMEGN